MKSIVVGCVAIGFAFGLMVAAIIEPYPCVPGEQRGCSMHSGASGVKYCNRNGWGWEPCQKLQEPYPQALWRQ